MLVFLGSVEAVDFRNAAVALYMVISKIIKKQTARGKSNNRYQELSFRSPDIFDIR
jgi:hypothetical protein